MREASHFDPLTVTMTSEIQGGSASHSRWGGPETQILRAMYPVTETWLCAPCEKALHGSSPHVSQLD
jgi:hypothetical protein